VIDAIARKTAHEQTKVSYAIIRNNNFEEASTLYLYGGDGITP
jgi:hypothetical protein